MPYKATHIPYGLLDPSKRTIVNPGIKDEVTFLQYGIETGGEQFRCRTLVNGGGGVPIHRHYGYGETFYPVEGTIGVVGENGNETMMLSSPSYSSSSSSSTAENDVVGALKSYTVKAGEWHRFFNPSPSSPITFEADVVPAHQGFEKLLHIFYGLVADGHGTKEGFPKSLFYLLMLNSMGEVGYPGVGGWLMGLVSGVVGWIAKVTGEEERLTVRYYGRRITGEEKGRWKVD